MKELTIITEEQIKIVDQSSLDKVKSMLEEQVKQTKLVVISDPYNKKQVEDVKTLKNKYVKNRCTISKVFKSDRDLHTKHNRKNREVELSILALMETEETRIGSEVYKAEQVLIKEERKKIIPFRKEKLAEYGSIAIDSDLLEMDDKAFTEFLEIKKKRYLDIKEQELRDAEILEKQRIELEKDKQEAIVAANIEAEKKLTAEKKRAANELEAEKEKSKAKQDKIEAELAASNAKAALAAKKIKDDAETERLKEVAKKEADKKAAKNTQYIEWKNVNNYSDNDIIDKEMQEDGKTKFTIFRAISEITI